MNATPHLQGDALIDDVTRAEPAAGEAAFWWLGQHSVILKLAGQIVYIDPYLSPNKARRVPPLFTAEQASNADLVIGTHDHSDHIDRPVWPTLMQASPAATFVVPEAVRPSLLDKLDLDAERLVGMDAGQSRTFGELKITAVAAAHELLDRHAESGLHPYLGFVLEGPGITVYHSGDTCMYEGLVSTLRRWPRLDLMFLPINGRGARQWRAGLAGNLTYPEAVDLAGTLEAAAVVPTHHDMFEGNLGDPESFCDYLQLKYPGVAPLRPGYGERTVVRGKTASDAG